MKTRLIGLWDALETSFWFVPVLMIVAAIGASFLLIEFDRWTRDKVVEEVGWVWSGGPEGARGLLSTIAGSMINLAGVVFSITIVALALATSQFGPRLLRNFIHDRGNQCVLGTFVATFVFCVLILRTVRGGDAEFVPHFAITFSVVLALAGIGVLIYFIHHVSTMIQASNIIMLVAQDLEDSIERLFPEPLGLSEEEVGERDHTAKEEIPKDFERQACPVPPTQNGYVQVIDTQGLMRLAEQHDLLIRLYYQPGRFITRESALLKAWPPERMSEALITQLSERVFLGASRTPLQDVEFAIDQLVEIALRALSPGVNDPFTAVTCVDYLGAALCQLAKRKLPSPYRYDRNKKLRVITDRVTFAGFVNAAFNQIRQYSGSSAAVTIRLLETLTVISTCLQKNEDQVELQRHALMIKRGSEATLAEEQDRRDVEERYQSVLRNAAKNIVYYQRSLESPPEAQPQSA